MPNNSPSTPRLSGRIVHLELIVLLLSLFSIGALFADTFFALGNATRALLADLDFIICLVFLADFFVHLWLAPSKTAYLKWGWIDFVSSIPAFSFLRWGRVFRVVRILRAFRSAKTILAQFSVEPAKGTFVIVVLTAIASVLFAPLAVLQVETATESNIRTPGDALWWAFATVTTIGYGDRYPVTAAGRVVAVVLTICGVSLFGTVTAYVASLFVLQERAQEGKGIGDLAAEIRLLREEISKLKPAGGAANKEVSPESE